MVFSLPHSRGAAVPQIANPIKFSRTEIDYRRAAPSLGEHTEAILSEELGLSLQSIQALKAAGTI
jgi:formyl-CoA transferase